MRVRTLLEQAGGLRDGKRQPGEKSETRRKGPSRHPNDQNPIESALVSIWHWANLSFNPSPDIVISLRPVSATPSEAQPEPIIENFLQPCRSHNVRNLTGTTFPDNTISLSRLSALP